MRAELRSACGILSTRQPGPCLLSPALLLGLHIQQFWFTLSLSYHLIVCFPLQHTNTISVSYFFFSFLLYLLHLGNNTFCSLTRNIMIQCKVILMWSNSSQSWERRTSSAFLSQQITSSHLKTYMFKTWWLKIYSSICLDICIYIKTIAISKRFLIIYSLCMIPTHLIYYFLKLNEFHSGLKCNWIIWKII